MNETRGIILRDEGDTLIVRATEADVRQFGSGDVIGFRKRLAHFSPWARKMVADEYVAARVPVRDVVARLILLRKEEWLYDADGHPVCQVRRHAAMPEPFGGSAGWIPSSAFDPLRMHHTVECGFDPTRFEHPQTADVVIWSEHERD